MDFSYYLESNHDGLKSYPYIESLRNMKWFSLFSYSLHEDSEKAMKFFFIKIKNG